MSIGGSIKENASNGDTKLLINNREITNTELMMLKMIGVQCEGKPHFWLQSDGEYQEEGQGRFIGNIWAKKREKVACTILSLPILPASSAVEPTEPLYDQKMLSKLLLIGNEKCGTTTIYKQARSLYNFPFSEEDRERIKSIIQTNLYAYLAMVLEAHERFEVEMSNNQSSDQTGDTGDEMTYYHLLYTCNVHSTHIILSLLPLKCTFFLPFNSLKEIDDIGFSFIGMISV